jgi:hemoglobin
MNTANINRFLIVCVLAALPIGVAGAGDSGSVADQMAGMQKMCSDTEAARSRRHAAEPLYNRLGGYDRIHQLTTEIVRLHNANPDINHMFEYVNSERLAKHVADFMAAGTGGSAAYTGRAMPAAHKNLHLTDADFLSAGGDIVTAMQSMDSGQNEIDEVVCILVSLKDQVVLK